MKVTALSTFATGSAAARDLITLFTPMTIIVPIRHYVRVMGTSFANGTALRPGTPHPQLSTSPGPSRFSSLAASTPALLPFTVLYAASDLATATYEAIIRDDFDLDLTRELLPSDYNTKSAVNISTDTDKALTLLDTTPISALRSSMPTDITRYSDHEAGKHFSEFVHKHMGDVDGILYLSRFTNRFCIAVYDRAIKRLDTSTTPRVLTRGILHSVLKPDLNIIVR